MVNATSSGLFVEIKEAPQSPGPGFDLWSYRLIKMAVDIAGKKKKKKVIRCQIPFLWSCLIPIKDTSSAGTSATVYISLESYLPLCPCITKQTFVLLVPLL